MKPRTQIEPVADSRLGPARGPSIRLLPQAVDLLVMVLAYVTAYALRFNFAVPAEHVHAAALTFPVVVAAQFLALRAFGCHRIAWQFITARDVLGFLYAAASSVTFLVLLRFVLPGQRDVRPPFSIALLNGVLFVSGALLVRVLWRLLREARQDRAAPGLRRRVLLVGAGRAGNAVARELQQQRADGVEVVGFLDDDPAKLGTVIQGAPVRGPIRGLAGLIRDLHVQEVILSMTGAPHDVVRNVVHVCVDAGVPVRMAPSCPEDPGGSRGGSRLRAVTIADLLGREEVCTGGDERLARFVNGKRVLVTGAGGTLGGELARQVARLGPAALVLVERSENAAFAIDRELRERGDGARLCTHVADVGDAARMRAILSADRPQILLHAAAHKHVPLMESNVAEAVANNVLATRRLGELAAEAGVACFVLLSSDKVDDNRASVMGATKRLAERAIQDLNGDGRTLFAAVRFGNVLGSPGSVVPLFAEQIRRGGPVTVTHPDMRRHFMTVADAALLVLHAASLAEGGEIFRLDMGEPVRVVDLAEEMIRLSGSRPHEDIRIVYIGLRPGEKAAEDPVANEEQARPTRHPRVFVAQTPTAPHAAVAAALAELKSLCERGAPDDTVRLALLKQA